MDGNMRLEEQTYFDDLLRRKEAQVGFLRVQGGVHAR